MRLQTRVILILSAVWVFLTFVIILDSKYLLQNSYTKLENELIVQNVNDVNKAFNRMVESLTLYTISWSVWDDSYLFMKNKNEAFIKSNFVPGTFISSQINFFIYYDTNASYYFGKAYDLKKNTLTNIPQGVLDYLK